MVKEIMQIVLSAIMALQVNIQSADLEKKVSYVGTWEWISTEVSARGGNATHNPETEKMTKHLIITETSIKVMENGLVVCEDKLSIKDSEDSLNGGLPHILESECTKGTFGIDEKGRLKNFQYLGCPSSTSYFIKSE